VVTRPIEFEDHWEASLDDDVNRCYFDYQFTLLLLDTETEIVIEEPFVITGPEDSWTLDPANPESMCPALSLLRKKVSTVVMEKVGTLRVNFSEGLQIVVNPNSEYEAWHVNLLEGWKFVAMPGGELAIWRPVDGSEAEDP